MIQTEPGRVILLGGSGAIGQVVGPLLEAGGLPITSLSSAECRITPESQGAVIEQLIASAPRAIVNLAGYVREGISDRAVTDVVHLNAVFPHALARAAAGRVPVIHLSTDCVFSGFTGPYDEDALCDATDLYGLSKAAGESAWAMVLRGSFLGRGAPPRNPSFLDWLQSKRGQTLGGFTNQRWNGVTTGHLGRVILGVLKDQRFAPGLFHLCSPDAVTRAELIQMVSERLDLGLTIKPELATRPCERLLATRHETLAPYLNVSLADQIKSLEVEG